MSEKKVTLDLTKPFLVWAIVFVMIAWATGNTVWLWVAFGPIVAWFVFVAGFVALGFMVMWLFWYKGKPVTLTTRAGKRIKQRGLPDVWLERK